MEKQPKKSNNEEAKKTAYNNQWVSTGLVNEPKNSERRDGPGGN